MCENHEKTEETWQERAIREDKEWDDYVTKMYTTPANEESNHLKSMVEYAVNCVTCKHSSNVYFSDPCRECLENPFDSSTNRPIKWEEK